MSRLTLTAFITSLIITGSALAIEADEVAVGTLSCKAEWNEFCEDQKTINVPDEHKLCKYTIAVKEKGGNSAYELVAKDSKSITVKFNAKGNRDRFKQESANIVLAISLFGVREDIECPPEVSVAQPEPTMATQQTITSPTILPTAAPQNTVPTPQTAPVVPIAQPSIPESSTAEAKPSVQPNTLPKVHACACSQWIDAGKVTNCLETGHGRDNAACDSYAVTIQCVTSREECREIQKDDCYQVMGLNQTTSQKRIFIFDSPYCLAKTKK